MKKILAFLMVVTSIRVLAQNSEYIHSRFCKNLSKVFELGRKDNFDGYDGTMVKQSPFLPVPGYSIKLDGFAVNYVDKDNRFVARTNLNLDSLSALQKMEELKSFIGHCLDSIRWNKWKELEGDDSSTAFFKELREIRTAAKEMVLILAVVVSAPKVYTINMYVKRRK